MIPDRSTFNTWDVAGLSGAGGEVENSVKIMKKAADDARDALSELNWEGAAAGAASSVFGDLFVESVIWESFGEDVSREIRSGARRLESAAPKIKFLVGAIESGPLYVDNQWVVMLRPVPMSRNWAKTMALTAANFQNQLNPLVKELGEADEAIATGMHGRFGRTDRVGDLPDLRRSPRDQVPDPMSEEGLAHQDQTRALAMATTVAERTESSEPGKRTVTLTMQDGSKHVYTDFDAYHRRLEHPLGGFGPTHPAPMQRVEMFDPSGRKVSSYQSWSGATRVTLLTEDGWLSVDQGSRGEILVMKDGVEVDPPPGLAEELFSHPKATVLGGAITALEEGTKLPAVSDKAFQKVHVGARFAGPGLAIGMAAYDVISADPEDKCVAAFSGISSAVGGYGLGLAGASGGPLTAAAAGVGGSWVFGYLGKKVGEMVCG